MKTSILQVAALGAAAAAFVPGVASAQDVVPVQPVPPPPAVVETAPPVAETTTTSEVTGPSLAMVGSGVAIFGLSYLPAVVVAAESNLSADHNLYVPFAGPWIDLAHRPGCSVDCNSENTAKVFIIIDGVFQAIGGLTVIGGFLTPVRTTKTVRTAALKPTLHLEPAQMGQGGYGMLAFGSF